MRVATDRWFQTLRIKTRNMKIGNKTRGIEREDKEELTLGEI